MTDTRRAEFDKWCRDNRWTPTESMWAAWEACSMRYDAATAVQGGEPVAWRVFDCSHWNDGKPNQQTIDYWKQQGVTLQYAYAAAPPAARQEEGRDAAIQYAEVPDEIVIDEDDAKALHNLADYTDFRIRLASLGVRVK